MGLRNSKTPAGCTAVAKVVKHLIFVRTVDDTGAANKITIGTDDMDQTYWEALVAQADKSKRLFPFCQKPFENAKATRADADYETMESGNKYFVQDGVKRFEAMLMATPPQLLKFIRNSRCEGMSVYVIDKDNNLIGSSRGEIGVLYPFRIADQTLMGMEEPATAKSIQKLKVAFDYHVSEKDEDVSLIMEAEMPYNPSNLVGLYDVEVAVSGITATGFTLKCFTPYGTVVNRLPVTGLVAGDFTLKNRASGATISITSVTENTLNKGTYVFVIASSPALKLQLTGTKVGYDFEILTNTVIETP